MMLRLANAYRQLVLPQEFRRHVAHSGFRSALRETLEGIVCAIHTLRKG